MKRKIKQQYPKDTFNDEHFLRQVITNASTSQASKSNEYEDEINTVAKYSNSNKNSNRDARVLGDDEKN